MAPRCAKCGDAGNIQAPATNAWRLYFERMGHSHYNVLVPCPACGGIMGEANRRELRERLAARKLAGTFPARPGT